MRIEGEFTLLDFEGEVASQWLFFSFRAKSCETVLLPFFSLSEQNKPEQFLVPKLEACC